MRRKRLLIDLLIMAALAGLTAWISLTMARIPGSVAAVWISNGIWACRPLSLSACATWSKC